MKNKKYLLLVFIISFLLNFPIDGQADTGKKPNAKILACYAALQESVGSLPEARSVNGFQKDSGIALIPDPKDENSWYFVTPEGVYRQTFALPDSKSYVVQNAYQIQFGSKSIRVTFENKGRTTLLSYAGVTNTECKNPSCITMPANIAQKGRDLISEDVNNRIARIALTANEAVSTTVARRRMVNRTDATIAPITVAPEVLPKYVKALHECENISQEKTQLVSAEDSDKIMHTLTEQRAELMQKYASAMRQLESGGANRANEKSAPNAPPAEKTGQQKSI